jgi:hypothetical protein
MMDLLGWKCIIKKCWIVLSQWKFTCKKLKMNLKSKSKVDSRNDEKFNFVGTFYNIFNWICLCLVGM